MARLAGVVSIFLGAIIIGFNPNRWDPVILDLPRQSHGIHVTDVVGMSLVTIGVVILWCAPRSN
jgi:hypothetical protein